MAAPEKRREEEQRKQQQQEREREARRTAQPGSKPQEPRQPQRGESRR